MRVPCLVEAWKVPKVNSFQAREEEVENPLQSPTGLNEQEDE